MLTRSSSSAASRVASSRPATATASPRDSPGPRSRPYSSRSTPSVPVEPYASSTRSSSSARVPRSNSGPVSGSSPSASTSTGSGWTAPSDVESGDEYTPVASGAISTRTRTSTRPIHGRGAGTDSMTTAPPAVPKPGPLARRTRSAAPQSQPPSTARTRSTSADDSDNDTGGGGRYFTRSSLGLGVGAWGDTGGRGWAAHQAQTRRGDSGSGAANSSGNRISVAPRKAQRLMRSKSSGASLGQGSAEIPSRPVNRACDGVSVASSASIARNPKKVHAGDSPIVDGGDMVELAHAQIPVVGTAEAPMDSQTSGGARTSTTPKPRKRRKSVSTDDQAFDPRTDRRRASKRSRVCTAEGHGNTGDNAPVPVEEGDTADVDGAGEKGSHGRATPWEDGCEAEAEAYDGEMQVDQDGSGRDNTMSESLEGPIDHLVRAHKSESFSGATNLGLGSNSKQPSQEENENTTKSEKVHERREADTISAPATGAEPRAFDEMTIEDTHPAGSPGDAPTSPTSSSSLLSASRITIAALCSQLQTHGTNHIPLKGTGEGTPPLPDPEERRRRFVLSVSPSPEPMPAEQELVPNQASRNEDEVILPRVVSFGGSRQLWPIAETSEPSIGDTDPMILSTVGSRLCSVEVIESAATISTLEAVSDLGDGTRAASNRCGLAAGTLARELPTSDVARPNSTLVADSNGTAGNCGRVLGSAAPEQVIGENASSSPDASVTVSSPAAPPPKGQLGPVPQLDPQPVVAPTDSSTLENPNAAAFRVEGESELSSSCDAGVGSDSSEDAPARRPTRARAKGQIGGDASAARPTSKARGKRSSGPAEGAARGPGRAPRGGRKATGHPAPPGADAASHPPVRRRRASRTAPEPTPVSSLPSRPVFSPYAPTLGRVPPPAPAPDTDMPTSTLLPVPLNPHANGISAVPLPPTRFDHNMVHSLVLLPELALNSPHESAHDQLVRFHLAQWVWSSAPPLRLGSGLERDGPPQMVRPCLNANARAGSSGDTGAFFDAVARLMSLRIAAPSHPHPHPAVTPQLHAASREQSSAYGRSEPAGRQDWAQRMSAGTQPDSRLMSQYQARLSPRDPTDTPFNLTSPYPPDSRTNATNATADSRLVLTHLAALHRLTPTLAHAPARPSPLRASTSLAHSRIGVAASHRVSEARHNPYPTPARGPHLPGV